MPAAYSLSNKLLSPVFIFYSRSISCFSFSNFPCPTFCLQPFWPSIQWALTFNFSFQPLQASNLRVHAGSCVVFLAPTETLLLQHQLPLKHSHPSWCFPDGTLQFCSWRPIAVQHSVRRWGGILHRAAPGSRRGDLPPAYPVQGQGLLSDYGDEADPLWDSTSVHGQSVSVCYAAHPSRISILVECDILGTYSGV